MAEPVIHKKTLLKPSKVQAYIKIFLRNTIVNSARELMTNGKIKIQDVEGDLIPMIYPYVTVHVCYNPYMNKAYIEYHLDDKMRHYIDKDKFSNYIRQKINNNMWEAVGVTPEILHEEDDNTSNVCDLSEVLSPYVVGYWKSLAGCFLFVEDSAWTGLHAQSIGLPGQSQEKPEKKIEDFHKIIQDIQAEYAQTALDDDKKAEYITKYYDILSKYKDDEDTLEEKIAELDTEYNIKNQLNSYIPEMYEKYMEAYEDFFGVTQRNIRATSVHYRFQLLNFV